MEPIIDTTTETCFKTIFRSLLNRSFPSLPIYHISVPFETMAADLFEVKLDFHQVPHPHLKKRKTKLTFTKKQKAARLLTFNVLIIFAYNCVYLVPSVSVGFSAFWRRVEGEQKKPFLT